ncbi:MAG: hypothetical protein PHX99_07500 [Synergistaceae bacterium]|nr:hypothetical protein [Synergistaceae bacterium]
MKKKISRIQRWLDRLSTACETGRWDSALVEADCLSAEVREIREDLTQKLENDHAAAVNIFSRSAVTMSIKSVGIALFIVLVSTIPLAVESERPWTAQTDTKAAQGTGDEILAWVTREEDELLRTLRSDLSGQNAGAIQTESVFSAPVKKRTSAQAKREIVVVSEIPAVRNIPVRSEAGISAEDLMALLQIGEKALRGDTPAIKVIK